MTWFFRVTTALAIGWLAGLGWGFESMNAWAYMPRFDQGELENIHVYETAAQAVVTIDTLVDGQPSSGAGVIIDESGMILTSGHLIGESGSTGSSRLERITVSLADGRSGQATLIGRTVGKSDLALLKATFSTPLPALRLGDSDQIRVGQKVLALGNPYGFERTLTTGIVSRIDTVRNRIQTDAAINPGNSGGPLLDTQGYVLGINQSIYNPEGNRSNIGIGFAVPVNTVKAFLTDLAASSPEVRAAVVRNRDYPETPDTGYETVSIMPRRAGSHP